jgi:hypothetical protein
MKKIAIAGFVLGLLLPFSLVIFSVNFPFEKNGPVPAAVQILFCSWRVLFLAAYLGPQFAALTLVAAFAINGFVYAAIAVAFVHAIKSLRGLF